MTVAARSDAGKDTGSDTGKSTVDGRSRTLAEGARVLVVRLSALGDVLFALETVASLEAERPDVTIDFLIEDRFASLLEGHPQIEDVLVYPRRNKAAIPAALLRLRRRRYDAVLDLHGILKSSVQVLFTRARRKLGYTAPGAREGAHRFYGERVSLPEPLPHRADRGYHLLRALGLEGRKTAPVLPPPDREIAFWREDGRPRVVLHPGTSAFAAFKRWPADRHARLATRLLEQGADVAVSFGPGERALAEEVVHGAAGARLLDGGEIGLRGLASVLGQARLVVAADTGPLHLAAAAGTTVLALFGPKDPDLYGPRAHGEVRHRLLYADVPCRPCKRRDCASPQCVLGLDVDRVAAAVEEVLG